ncbi:hypothetical protein GCM10008955_31140 [Deinococcus malanensis]|uniref:Uncharacterized protein n=1 Tax=Deinococcus malanensis TaxID=1706855 RepID=A0ABQ2F2F6_9DEIO|nr:hypothetical protein [Deinococcus malanensis]GGK34964.1 hypothetical protein GCM10008955_31140 [Deinococcus malanensis]
MDFLDLALCALALTLAVRARRAFLEGAQTSHLPPAEQWWWLGVLAVTGIKLLMAVRLYG